MDIELPELRLRINGFPAAAALIANASNNLISIYHTFKTLAARNLLYIGVELFELQDELNILGSHDSEDN